MKCSPEEMRRSAMAAVRAAESDRTKEFQRRQENITGPKSLKRGVHMHQIRTKPAYVEQMVNQFIREMSRAWPTFRILQTNTQMTFSAMYVYITYQI